MEKYLRETLEVHKSIKKIGIRVSASIDGVDEFVTTLRDESTLWGLLGQLEWHREAILSGKKVQLRGKLISLMWVAQLPRPPPPSGVTGDSRHPGLPHPGNSRPHPGQLTPGRAIYLVHKLHKLMHYISNLCITYLNLIPTRGNSPGSGRPHPGNSR